MFSTPPEMQKLIVVAPSRVRYAESSPVQTRFARLAAASGSPLTEFNYFLPEPKRSNPILGFNQEQKIFP
jgi:hypothetical protein